MIAYVYVYTTVCVPGACRGQKRALDPLELVRTIYKPLSTLFNIVFSFVLKLVTNSSGEPVHILVGLWPSTE